LHPAFNSEEAMRGVKPQIGWTGGVFALLLDNVWSPVLRAERSQAVAALFDVRTDYLDDYRQPARDGK
jgi:hypothetical protein